MEQGRVSSSGSVEDDGIEEPDTVHRLGFQFRPIAIGLNLFFAATFMALHVWPMVVVYLASIALSGFIEYQARRQVGKGMGILKWIWLVVLMQSIMAVAMVGVKADFQFYAISTFPMIFANERWSLRAKVAQSMIVSLFLILCVVVSSRQDPAYLLAPLQMDLLRAINAIGICVMLAALSHKVYLTLKETELKLHGLANTDALTGLLNRRRIMEDAQKGFSRRRRHGAPLSVIIGDIDHFKRINDAYGHDVGDRVLQGVAAILKATRGHDEVARWGGEEFIVLMPDTGGESAMKVAERICREVSKSPMLVGEHAIPVSMTLGVAQLQADETWQEMLARADQALYRGKNAGRNRFELAG